MRSVYWGWNWFFFLKGGYNFVIQNKVIPALMSFKLFPEAKEEPGFVRLTFTEKTLLHRDCTHLFLWSFFKAAFYGVCLWTFFCNLPPLRVGAARLCLAYVVNIFEAAEAVLQPVQFFCDASLEKSNIKKWLIVAPLRADTCLLLSTHLCLWKCPCNWSLFFFVTSELKLLFTRCSFYFVHPFSVHENSIVFFFSLFLLVKSWQKAECPSILIKAVKTNHTHFCPE